eukprot:CAMPEP_0194776428 /NCGR_PEP_ID=MMETSP0323_2-20130528/63062_1 /TAXON_ID=2866 ORGANISM="Crypthecodinium cohnii, Strain Seligo" /NCGR_SAMPLE_ID=MMETSP0323_2 /ASSEMBLY_ACC=CAM_ASM_000346 /LENGTH=67 /DNA_ID=CAMNT_0039712839 /DNA_START=204 /DNA_END=407 /DNA_ORIENTATION=+
MDKSNAVPTSCVCPDLHTRGLPCSDCPPNAASGATPRDGHTVADRQPCQDGVCQSIHGEGGLIRWGF